VGPLGENHPEKDYFTLFHVSARKCEKPLLSQSGTNSKGSACSLAGSDYNLLVKDNDLQTNSLVQGSRGIHKKRTLATFSFEVKLALLQAT
jgi:hypothetical protein